MVLEQQDNATPLLGTHPLSSPRRGGSCAGACWSHIEFWYTLRSVARCVGHPAPEEQSSIHRAGRIRSVIPTPTWHAPRDARAEGNSLSARSHHSPVTGAYGQWPRAAGSRSSTTFRARHRHTIRHGPSAERAVSCGHTVPRCRQSNGEDDGLRRWAILPSRSVCAIAIRYSQ